MRSILRRADVVVARRAASAIRRWKVPRFPVGGPANTGTGPVSGIRHRETAAGESA